MNTIKPLLSASQVLLSSYGLYASYNSIVNVREYEDQTKTAAQYSGAAEEQLHKTRTTLTSGTITLLISLGTAIGALTAPSSLNVYAWTAISLANSGLAFTARRHIREWWHGKAKIPLVDKYNMAISSTLAISNVLGLLSGAWALKAMLDWAI